MTPYGVMKIFIYIYIKSLVRKLLQKALIHIKHTYLRKETPKFNTGRMPPVRTVLF